MEHFPHYWPFVRGIHRSPMNSPHKGQWRGALMFSLICTWKNGSVNSRDTGDLRHSCAHYDVTNDLTAKSTAVWKFRCFEMLYLSVIELWSVITHNLNSFQNSTVCHPEESNLPWIVHIVCLSCGKTWLFQCHSRIWHPPSECKGKMTHFGGSVVLVTSSYAL